MITSYGNITVISSDRSLINFLRQISQEKTLKDCEASEILLIDQRNYKKNSSLHSIEESDSITKIYITEDTSYENLTLLLNKSQTYIICHPVNKNLLKCIIEKINSNRKLIKYKNLELNLIENSLFYKGCKFYLNNRETSILKIIIQHDGFASIKQIMNYKQDIFSCNNNINSAASGINKKIYESVRKKIIINRYGKGYYLDI